MHASNDLQENHKMPGIKACANWSCKFKQEIVTQTSYHMLAFWISSLLQSFDGSSVKEILTSLVATTSTDMPKSSNIENMKLFSIFLFGHKPRKNEILSQQKAKGHPIISISP